MKKKYYLATNEKDIFHYGDLEDGQEIKTGQPFLFYFDNEQELIEALKKYNQTYDTETN